jgi:hypothetical protein
VPAVHAALQLVAVGRQQACAVRRPGETVRHHQRLVRVDEQQVVGLPARKLERLVAVEPEVAPLPLVQLPGPGVAPQQAAP